MSKNSRGEGEGEEETRKRNGWKLRATLLGRKRNRVEKNEKGKSLKVTTCLSHVSFYTGGEKKGDAARPRMSPGPITE